MDFMTWISVPGLDGLSCVIFFAMFTIMVFGGCIILPIFRSNSHHGIQYWNQWEYMKGGDFLVWFFTVIHWITHIWIMSPSSYFCSVAYKSDTRYVDEPQKTLTRISYSTTSMNLTTHESISRRWHVIVVVDTL